MELEDVYVCVNRVSIGSTGYYTPPNDDDDDDDDEIAYFTVR